MSYFNKCFAPALLCLITLESKRAPAVKAGGVSRHPSGLGLDSRNKRAC